MTHEHEPDELPDNTDSWFLLNAADGSLPPGVARRRRAIRVTLISVLAVAVLLIGAFLIRWLLVPPTVSVPTVTGLDVPTARSRLAESGLRLTVAGERFSASAPRGSIVEQQPRSGSAVSRDTAVSVYVSAGVDTFAMPDVIGLVLEQAEALLDKANLYHEVIRVASHQASGTVVATSPSPGVSVSTADMVRLTISSGEASSTVLLPEDLSGKTFVLDPGPSSHAGPDMPLEVARRLRALLEASGAQVRVTRTANDSLLSDAARLQRALEATGTALIAVRVEEQGIAGVALSIVPTTTATPKIHQLSMLMARAVTSALVSAGLPARAEDPGSDPLLLATKVPAVRVRLGSYQSVEDALSFADPAWADALARAVYRGCASVFRPVADTSGVRQTTETTRRP